MINKPAIILLMLVCCSVSNAKLRIWSDVKGNTVEAEYVCEVAGKITLRDSKGKEYRLSLEQLSENDQEYLQSLLPPKLEIDFNKSQDRRKKSTYYSELNIKCTASINKKSRLPYDRELKAVMVVLGYKEDTNEYIVLDRTESKFYLNSAKEHQFAGSVFRLREYKRYSSNSRGTRYRGYLIGVFDPDGKRVAVKSSSDKFTENLKVLTECKTGERLDRSFEKLESVRSF